MWTPEQRAAVKEVRSWYRGNEERVGLKLGSTRNFSLVRERRLQALRTPVVHQGLDSSDEISSNKISLPDLYRVTIRLRMLFDRAVAIF